MEAWALRSFAVVGALVGWVLRASPVDRRNAEPSNAEPEHSGMGWAMEELGLEQKFPAFVIFKGG